MAELDRLERLAALDQIGVVLEDREDLLVIGHLLALEHSSAGLVDNSFAQGTIVGELLLDLSAAGQWALIDAIERVGNTGTTPRDVGLTAM